MDLYKCLLCMLLAIGQLACSPSPRVPDADPIERVSMRADDPRAQRGFDDAVVLLRRGQYQESVDALKLVAAEHPQDKIAPVTELYIARAQLGKVQIDEAGKWTSSATKEQLEYAERALGVLGQAPDLDATLSWSVSLYQAIALTLLGKGPAALALLKGYPGPSISDAILPEDRVAAWLIVAQALRRGPEDRSIEALFALGQLYTARVSPVPMPPPLNKGQIEPPEPATPPEQVLPAPDDDAVLSTTLAMAMELGSSALKDEGVQQQCFVSSNPLLVGVSGWMMLRAALGRDQSGLDDEALLEQERVATRTSSAFARLGALSRVAELSSMMATSGDRRKLVIGALLPLSGPNKAVGLRLMRGLLLAQDAFASSPRARLTLVFEDSEGDPVTRFDRLMAQNPLAIVGPIEREKAASYGSLAIKAKVPMITFSTQAMTKPAEPIKPEDAYVFRHFLEADAEAEAVASLSFTQLKDRRVVILYPKMPYGELMAKRFVSRFEGLGGEVVLMEQYDRDKNDYSALARKVASRQLDAIFIPDTPQKVSQLSAFLARENVWGVAPQVAPATKSGRKQVHYLGTSLWQDRALIDLASTYIQGAMIPAWYSESISSPLVRDFASQHRAIFASEPSIYEAFAYDAMSWLRQLTLDAGMRRPASVRDALLRPEGFNGVTGQATFQSWGEPQRRLRFVRVDGTGFAPTPWVERINALPTPPPLTPTP